MTFQKRAGQRLECDGPLECSDISVVLALPLGVTADSLRSSGNRATAYDGQAPIALGQPLVGVP